MRICAQFRREPHANRHPGSDPSAQGFGEILWPPIGTILMDRCRPRQYLSAASMMRSAAIAMVCRPDEQKRLTVMAEASAGRPARRRSDTGDVHSCSASGSAQPRITSSISRGSSPGTRANAPRIAVAANRLAARHGESLEGFADRGPYGTDDHCSRICGIAHLARLLW